MRSSILLFLTVSLAFAAEGDVEVGKEVFRMCSGCHNTTTDARKMGPSLRTLWGKVLLRNGKRTNEANVSQIILEGYNGMPAYQNLLRPGELDHLLAYLKTLKGRPATASQVAEASTEGEGIFKALCSRCHGTGSKVLDKAGDLKGLFDKPTLSDGSPVTERRVAALLEEGHGGAASFKEWLPPNSSRALLDYLRALK